MSWDKSQPSESTQWKHFLQKVLEDKSTVTGSGVCVDGEWSMTCILPSSPKEGRGQSCQPALCRVVVGPENPAAPAGKELWVQSNQTQTRDVMSTPWQSQNHTSAATETWKVGLQPLIMSCRMCSSSESAPPPGAPTP